jgi:hypothetical protein
VKWSKQAFLLSQSKTLTLYRLVGASVEIHESYTAVVIELIVIIPVFKPFRFNIFRKNVCHPSENLKRCGKTKLHAAEGPVDLFEIGFDALKPPQWSSPSWPSKLSLVMTPPTNSLLLEKVLDGDLISLLVEMKAGFLNWAQTVLNVKSNREFQDFRKIQYLYRIQAKQFVRHGELR